MKKIFFFFLVGVLFFLFSSRVNSATLNVPADYATINGAIGAASSGDVIVVAAGSYPDKYIVINKPLTLEGANAGIPGTSGTRGPETILSGGYYVMSPQADDIVIDGFKIVSTGGRVIDTYADANNFHLTNTILENTATYVQQGVIQFGGGSHENMTIDFNSFVYGEIAMLYFGGGPYTNLHINHNHFSGSGDGVFWAAQPLSGGIIENNIFNQSVALNIGQGGDLKIRNNNFDGCFYTAFQVGLLGGQITYNAFQNLTPYPGYWGDAFQLWGGEWGTAASANVLISNNTVYF
ncbi:hypothetical protein KAH55_06155, partial [bacterium]|nr:hypothetical protein [bacterium]